MTESEKENNTFALNSIIGFLSLLLIVLLFALGSRVIFPRIETRRADDTSKLISNVIQIEVLNGCGVPGLAEQFTSLLRQNGFDVVETGNFKNFDLQKTIVIAHTLNKENAERVANALGISPQNVIIEASDDFYIDATVVIGSDYQSLNQN